MSRPLQGLWLITDTATAQHPLLDIVKTSLEAGFQGVMLREKQLPGGPLLALAQEMLEVCKQYGRDLIINDRTHVALALPGTGIHTGSQGLPVSSVRELLGNECSVGYSAHDGDEAAKALAEGADYVSLSPVFPSITKPHLSPRGEVWLQESLAQIDPLRAMALGGIQAPNLKALSACGIAGAFIMGSMMQAENPRDTARDLITAWNG